MHKEVIPTILWIVGALFLVGGIVVYVIQIYAPVPRPEPLQGFDLEFSRLPIIRFPGLMGFVMAGKESTPEKMIADLRIIASEPVPFVWDDAILLRDRADLVMAFQVPNGTITTLPVEIYQWSPGIDETNIFDPGNDTALSWQDTDGRYGLWVHSGLYQTMSDLQNWLERDDNGDRVTSELAESRLQLLVGQGVTLIQSGESASATMGAAIRIGPWEVEALSAHNMDLIEYLDDNHPGYNFASLRSRQDVLMLYFCGMALAGETPNPNYDRWTQARFIIALVPYEEDGQGLIVE